MKTKPENTIYYTVVYCLRVVNMVIVYRSRIPRWTNYIAIIGNLSYVIMPLKYDYDTNREINTIHISSS